jgi:hypothetical protein
MFWFKNWRRKKLSSQPFPQDWLAILQGNVPYYNKLPLEDKTELRRHILIFLGEKRFESCGGLQITDEIKVTIAAQACILLLHRRTDYYPDLYSILVYPQAYVATHAEHLASGVVAEGLQIRLGESWHRGSVVLSWDDVRRSAADMHDGYNIVFHEFAHQLDSSGGKRDSTPVLQKRSNYIAWARVLQKDYQKLQSDVNNNRQTVLDEYGVTNPAEFFAVATECFFERPKQLQEHHPELYDELKFFYQQDPAKLLQ